MEKVLIVTIRGKGGGAEKIIEGLVKSDSDKFKWINMESFLSAPYFYKYARFILEIFKNIKYYDRVIVGSEGLLGLIVFPFKLFSKKKFILWNHCYYDEYKYYLSKKRRLLFSLSYSMYSLKINASPVSSKGVFIPNPYQFRPIFNKNNKFLNDSSVTLLSVSSLAKLKCIDLTINLLSELPREFVLDVFGEGAEEESLKALAANVGVKERTRFLGYKNDPFCFDESKARILIINSYTEALPTIILESVEHYIPVIVRAYSGSEYWEGINTVFVVNSITSKTVFETLSYFKSLSGSNYADLFNADINYLKRKHSYDNFAKRLGEI